MITKSISVLGMVCDACVKHVTQALQALPGVQKASVSLQEKRATVTFDPDKATLIDLRNAVEQEGYDAAA